MTALYWVGGIGTWDATAGTKWATSSGGAGGHAVPGAGDDVIIDANGTNIVTLGVDVTINTLALTGACAIDARGFTTTLMATSGTVLAIGTNSLIVGAAGGTYSTFVIGSPSDSDRTISTGDPGALGLSTLGNLVYDQFGTYGFLYLAGTQQSFHFITIGSHLLATDHVSTLSADRLTMRGRQTDHVRLPALVGNYVTLPDSAHNSPAGSYEMQMRISADDWTPATAATLLSKFPSSDFAFSFALDTSGHISYYWSNDGFSIEQKDSPAPTGFSDGAVGWIAVTHDISTGTVTYYTAPDSPTVPVSWTSLGTAAATPGTVHNSSGAVEFGSYQGGAGTVFAGNIYRMRLLDGTNHAGTVQTDVDFSMRHPAQDSFPESAHGETVTAFGQFSAGSDGRASLVPNVFGIPASLSVPAPGACKCEGLFVHNITASGGALFYAGRYSQDSGGNSGWRFTSAPKSPGMVRRLMVRG